MERRSRSNRQNAKRNPRIRSKPFPKDEAPLKSKGFSSIECPAGKRTKAYGINHANKPIILFEMSNDQIVPEKLSAEKTRIWGKSSTVSTGNTDSENPTETVIIGNDGDSRQGRDASKTDNSPAGGSDERSLRSSSHDEVDRSSGNDQIAITHDDGSPHETAANADCASQPRTTSQRKHESWQHWTQEGKEQLYNKLKEKVDQMIAERTCKICLSGEVTRAFKSCGHLCCCTGCAKLMKNCPICREPVHGSLVVVMPKSRKKKVPMDIDLFLQKYHYFDL